MARIRTIKPEFFRDKKLSECSVSAQLTFSGLWCVADDEGRYLYEPELLKADVWPMRRSVGPDDVAGFVGELTASGMVCEYEVAGQRYLHVVNWHKHQNINRPSPSKLPECSRTPHGALSESSALEVEREVEREVETTSVDDKIADPEDSSGDEPPILEAEVIEPENPEAKRLCDLLADAIQANTGRRPNIGKRWVDAARLLLDRDGLTVKQVEFLIDWSQRDEFWRANILSMPKLREKRDTLILRIKAEQNGGSNGHQHRHQASINELLRAGDAA